MLLVVNMCEQAHAQHREENQHPGHNEEKLVFSAD